MSQKVRIERVTITGATPFLGLSDNTDPVSERLYSRNGDTVMEWLASAWRTRLNAYRPHTHKDTSALNTVTD